MQFSITYFDHFINQLSKKYWFGELTKSQARDHLNEMNRYRCGRHYMVTGSENVEAVKVLLGIKDKKKASPTKTHKGKKRIPKKKDLPDSLC